MDPNGVLASGELLKWTNYILGWQVRYFKLARDGYISYSLSKEDSMGTKGSIKIDKMILQLHKQSEVRFDIVTPSVTWYLRSYTPLDRDTWTGIIEKQREVLPMSISREGSVLLLAQSSLEVLSDLNIKLDELNSFKDSLSQQLSEIRSTLNHESPKLKQKLATIQATVSGIVATSTNCIEMFNEREQYWQDQIAVEKEKSQKLEILYSATNRENTELIKHNAPQGPHLNEDEFFDAIEETLDKMDNLEEKLQNLEVEVKKPDTSSDKKDHRMYNQMQELINKYVELSKQDPEAEPSWQCLSKSGVTKIYRKEEEKDGVLLDYLVATTTVEGVTAAEMSEVFHNGKLKLEWDHTIEADKKLETLDDYCAVYHQILKRVWPTAQRDLVYASHKQRFLPSQLDIPGEHPSWIVCNVSCDHPSVPEGTSGYTRATIEVVLFCQTVCDKTDPTRKDVSCKIVYSASVNPGGWAPASAVRAISQREYPKFLKKIATFAIDHVKKREIKY
ncbi:ceramide transfer protein-like isoform X2 [Bolinopsis microptera]|uniref:ceramide transfer protein-like isoform X2 n=1 Tax=Bolinopsis microptera TaxID=2820187 RepID=UPI0030797F2D